MRPLFPLVTIALLAPVLAGCIQAPDEPLAEDTAAPSNATEIMSLIGEPIEQKHDHTNASLHTGAHNLEFVNWDPFIPEDLGEEGFAGLRIVGDYGYLATDGAYAGFLIIDLSDPRNPELVSQYKTPGGASQEAVPSWDGNWVFLNLQSIPSASEVADDPERGTGTGLQIINVEDKENPRFEKFVPVEAYGTHVMYYYEWNNEPYLVFNGQPLRQGIPTGDVYTMPAGNVVKIQKLEVINGEPTLVPVSEFRYTESVTAQTRMGCFPHDMWVEENPLTGQDVMYVAHWDCGMVTVDVTDPATPTFLDAYDDMAPSTRNNIHFARPDPVLRDDRYIAYSTPEIDLSPGEAGYLRVYDVTDPADVDQIGHWTLPGSVENDQPFLFTPHNFETHGDLLALAHYHAGVWVLDVSDPTDPKHVAYYLPHGEHDAPYEGDIWHKTPNFPEPYFPNVYEVRWMEDGDSLLLQVSERGSGLYTLEYTGPR